MLMVQLRAIPGDYQFAVGFGGSLEGMLLDGSLRDMDSAVYPCSRRPARLVHPRG